MPNVFLDHQSSTPLLPEAFEAMKPFYLESFGTASSLHRHGIKAREALAAARAQLAGLVGAPSPEDLTFTSGGTEAVNLAVKGVAYANRHRGQHIVLSAVEHPAIQKSVEFLEQQGFRATRVRVDCQGRVDPADVKSALGQDTILICVQHVNHDVGTVQAVREIAALAGERGVPLLVDANFSAGWLPIQVQDWEVDLLSVAPHRFYGPKGVGVLYRRRGVRLASLLHGGDQEKRLRAGTENVPAIVGAGIAAQAALRDLPARQAHTARLQADLWQRLSTAVPYLALNGPTLGPERITTNLNVSPEFVEGEGVLLSLDMAGIAVASGTACVSNSVKVSPVLEAMGLDRALAQASIIFSLGKDNTAQEMEFTAGAFAKAVQRLRGMSPLWEEFQRGLIDSIVQPRTRTVAKPAVSAAH